MNKINNISSHISKCKELLENNNVNEKKEYIEEMISVYESEIKLFSNNLNVRSVNTIYCGLSQNDLQHDLKRIIAMLENYKINIKQGILSTSKSNGININNISTSECKVNVSITLEQVINNINELPNDILSQKEKEDLEDKIRVLESVIKSGDKEKISKKIKKLFDYSLEKGPAVIALVSKVLSLFTDKILTIFK